MEEKLYFFKPINCRKFHIYNKSGRSLCGKWMLLYLDKDEEVKGNETQQKDDCSACFKKMKKLTGE